VALGATVVVAELIICRECGTELEVASLEPPSLVPAPTEEEDWGE
jgi:alpha-aminoadipate carrier protein LysW